MWGLPPWSSRWRRVLPELAGIGATPAARASLAAVAKRWAPAISPTSLAAVSGPNPGSLSSCGASCATSSGDLALEPGDRLGELAQPAQPVAGDPDTHGLLGPGQAPRDPRAPLLREQGATWQLELGPEVVELPQQRAVELDAVTNKAFAVVDEQAEVELGPVQMSGREGLQPLPQRGTGDVERVDRVGLAALAGAPARIGGQVRRNPQHALAALDQKSLQRPRHVPAVFKRPRPLAVDASRPSQQGAESAQADRDGLLAQEFAGRGRDGRDGVRTLVGVRAEHDHGPRPPLPRQRRTPGGHGLLEAVPRIYQVTPDIPDRRRATKQKEVRP